MDRRSWSLIIFLCILGGLYAFGFSDWFARKTIHVSVSYRPAAPGANADIVPMVFGLDEDYPLTQIKISELPNGDTNAPGSVTWHVASKTKTDPIRGFVYGENLKGLEPAPGSSGIVPLKPGSVYRVDVAAGKIKGTSFFNARAPDAPQ